MTALDPTRRSFLRLSGSAGLGAWLTLNLAGCREAAESASEAARTGAPPRVLTEAERRALEAFADGVIPPEGDAPGAAGMGAVLFMDHYLADRPEQLAGARAALEAVEARAREAHGAATGLADLDAGRREALMAELTEGAPEHFFPLWTLVLYGAFAHPARGGNVDRSGWALLDFDDRHAWSPPFGFYDAQVGAGGGA